MILTLTGPFAGKTVLLNGRQFVGGRLEIVGDPRSCQLIADYYRRCYEVAIDGDLLAKPTPTEEELKLLDAIQQTPREEWVTDDDGEHPTVAAVALVTGNYRLTKEEIVGVLKKWPLSS